MIHPTDAIRPPGSPSRVCAALSGLLVIVLLLLCASVASADETAGSAEQTDWSDGPGSLDPVDAWASGFESAHGVSWLAASGQITLSSHPLTSPVRYRIATDAVRPAGLAAGDVDKDGYTDLRGRFDYTSLNTSGIEAAEKFAILIMSEEHGAVVREADPPKM